MAIPTCLKQESKQVFSPPITYKLSEMQQAELLRFGVKRDTETRTFNFIDLEMALTKAKGFKEYAKYNSKLSVLVGRYIPFLWDGSTGFIAVDIDASSCNKVVVIQKQDEQPLREAYSSFREFLNDAIRANENNEPLACLLTPGKLIKEESQNLSELSCNTTRAPKAGTNRKKIPTTENVLTLRTDFSDESAWKALCAALHDPEDEFSPSLDFVSDTTYEGITADELPLLLPEDSSISFAFIIDRNALTDPDHPILVIDLQDKPGRTFRVTPSSLGDVANNLSIANMDFDEFAKAAGPDGIFRGFSRA